MFYRMFSDKAGDKRFVRGKSNTGRFIPLSDLTRGMCIKSGSTPPAGLALEIEPLTFLFRNCQHSLALRARAMDLNTLGLAAPLQKGVPPSPERGRACCMWGVRSKEFTVRHIAGRRIDSNGLLRLSEHLLVF